MAAGKRPARTGDLILIRVLHPGCFCRIRPASWVNDAPLQTATNCSVPLACGPNVDQGHRFGIGPLDGCSAASTAQEAQYVVLEPAFVGLADRMADPVIEPQRGWNY
jgi:hypothetical protein